MSTTRYKGFTILTEPYLLRESQEWTADLAIRRYRRLQTFRVADRYPTREDADLAVTDFGRRIVDGTVPGRSVRRLRGRSDWAEALIHYWETLPVRRVIAGGVGALCLGGVLLIMAPDLVPTFLGQAALLLGLGLFAVGLGKQVATSRSSDPAPHPRDTARHYQPAEGYLVKPHQSARRVHVQAERPILPHRHAYEAFTVADDSFRRGRPVQPQ